MIRLNLNVPLTRRSHPSPRRFLFCLICPKRLVCSVDGLETPGTVLDRAGQKKALGRAWNEIVSGTTQISLRDALEDVVGDALTNIAIIVPSCCM
jgi:hypothetical protein